MALATFYKLRTMLDKTTIFKIKNKPIALYRTRREIVCSEIRSLPKVSMFPTRLILDRIEKRRRREHTSRDHDDLLGELIIEETPDPEWLMPAPNDLTEASPPGSLVSIFSSRRSGIAEPTIPDNGGSITATSVEQHRLLRTTYRFRSPDWAPTYSRRTPHDLVEGSPILEHSRSFVRMGTYPDRLSQLHEARSHAMGAGFHMDEPAVGQAFGADSGVVSSLPRLFFTIRDTGEVRPAAYGSERPLTSSVEQTVTSMGPAHDVDEKSTVHDELDSSLSVIDHPGATVIARHESPMTTEHDHEVTLIQQDVKMDESLPNQATLGVADGQLSVDATTSMDKGLYPPTTYTGRASAYPVNHHDNQWLTPNSHGSDSNWIWQQLEGLTRFFINGFKWMGNGIITACNYGLQTAGNSISAMAIWCRDALYWINNWVFREAIPYTLDAVGTGFTNVFGANPCNQLIPCITTVAISMVILEVLKLIRIWIQR